MVIQIPMAALVGVMFMVSIGTFDWSFIKTLRVVLLFDSAVMVVTIATVILTYYLAIGVFVGTIVPSSLQQKIQKFM
jgi:SulP family sulfate permease